jgi:hypothetical protein
MGVQANVKRDRRYLRNQVQDNNPSTRQSEQDARNRLMPIRKNKDGLVVYDRHKKRATLKDTLSGCSMFMVCGGPSLKLLDLSQLTRRGVVSLGINNVSAIAPVNYFLCSDPPEKFHSTIWFDPRITKLIPICKARKERLRIKRGDKFYRLPFRPKDVPNIFFFERREWFDPEDFLTSEAATWGNNEEAFNAGKSPRLLFTFFLGLRLCHYLGVSNLFLLGVDFNMTSDSPYAFAQSEMNNSCKTNNGSYKKAIEWCRQLKPKFDEAGFNVFNCNPVSALDVFPYVSFEQAVATCRGPFIDDNPDTADWYVKEEDEKGKKDGGDSKGNA